MAPEQLQEAVDTIVSEFGYPIHMTIEYETLDNGTKQTTFIPRASPGSPNETLTLEHEADSNHPTLVDE